MRKFSLKTRENYLHNSKQGRLVRIGAYVLLALLFVYLGGAFLGSIASKGTRVFFGAASYFENSSAVLPEYLRSRTDLLAEMNELNAALSAHSGDAATIARLIAENDELHALLGTSSEKRILAGVIGRPPQIPYDVLYLDRGSRDGILLGAVVYHANDQAIGYVSAVYDTSALVTLFSTYGVTATVYVFGPNVYATAYGEGGGVVRIAIPQGLQVTEGDVVVIPSVPVGTLGVVTHVESVATEPEQNAYLTFAAPIQSLHAVSVSTRSIEPISFEDAQVAIDAKIGELFVVTVPEQFTHTSATSSLFEAVGTSTRRVPLETIATST